MRCFLRAVLPALLAVVAVSATAETVRAQGCTIYEDRDFQGRSRDIGRNEKVRYLGRRWDDRASSVKVTPSCRLISFENSSYIGDRRTFRRNTAWVENYWDNEMSSVQCMCGVQSHDNTCVLYDGPLYKGTHDHIDKGKRAETLDKTSRKISSLLIPDGCTLKAYSRDGLAGSKNSFRAGRHRLTGTRWDDRIRSAQCSCQAQSDDKCVLYSRENRQGRTLTISKNRQRSTFDRSMDDNVSSLSVPNGCVLRAFQRPQLGGRRKTYRAGVQDSLGSRWGDAISSAQCLCSDDQVEPPAQQLCTLYSRENQRGRRLAIRDGRDVEVEGTDLEQSVSSVGLDDTCQVTLSNQSGDSITLRSSRDRLGRRWRRSTVSASCACSTDTGGGNSDDGDDDTGNGDGDDGSDLAACELFDRRNYRGDSIRVAAGQSMRSLGSQMNNKTSSLTVANGCRLEIFENRNFNRNSSGFRGTYRSDVTRLNNRLNDQISSARCTCNRDFGGSSDERSGAARAASDSSDDPATIEDDDDADFDDSSRSGRVTTDVAVGDDEDGRACLLYDKRGLKETS